MKSAKSFLGKDGAFVPLLESILNAALEGEMDAIHYKVTDERGCAVSRAIYNVLGIDKEGHKDVLGMYLKVRKLISG